MNIVYVALDSSRRPIGIYSTYKHAVDGVAEWVYFRTGENLTVAWDFEPVHGYWKWRDITIEAYRVDLGRVMPSEVTL